CKLTTRASSRPPEAAVELFERDRQRRRTPVRTARGARLLAAREERLDFAAAEDGAELDRALARERGRDAVDDAPGGRGADGLGRSLERRVLARKLARAKLVEELAQEIGQASRRHDARRRVEPERPRPERRDLEADGLKQV